MLKQYFEYHNPQGSLKDLVIDSIGVFEDHDTFYFSGYGW